MFDFRDVRMFDFFFLIFFVGGGACSRVLARARACFFSQHLLELRTMCA